MITAYETKGHPTAIKDEDMIGKMLFLSMLVPGRK